MSENTQNTNKKTLIKDLVFIDKNSVSKEDLPILEKYLKKSEEIVEKIYDAGKLHNELILSFDNPYSRFINSEI